MLSFSNFGSAVYAQSSKVSKATAIVKEKEPHLVIEGEMQADTALVSEYRQRWYPFSQLKKDANVLIFPDLNTGNNTYKAVQRETGAIAIGPVLQGLNKPVNDLSRGCLVEDIVNTVIITAIQAQNNKLK